MGKWIERAEAGNRETSLEAQVVIQMRSDDEWIFSNGMEHKIGQDDR